MSTGTVKWYSEEKKYGFITDDGTNIDHFVHVSDIEITDYTIPKTLEQGQKVTFKLETSNRGNGYKCSNVRIIK